jgi:peptide/nickel transport system permease protein
MVQTVLKRLAWSIVVLFGLSLVIFMIVRIVPGDPARMALGARASEETVQMYREEMHLNEPLYVQYTYWIKGVVQGDLGMSISTKRPVTTDIKEFAPATIELVFFAGFLQIVFGLILGVFGAMYSNRWPDTLIRIVGYIGVATPAFVVAVLLLLIFGYWIPILPAIGGRLSPNIAVTSITGMVTLDALLTGNVAGFIDGLFHVILPAVALSLGSMMQESRITRSSMLSNMDKDYIAMITSQGVPNSIIKWNFLLKPSVIPTVSIIGLDFAALFGNAFLVEQIFNWPGLSWYGLNAMLAKDINATCAVVLFMGVVFVLMNIIVDIVVSFLDPRLQQNLAS